MKFSELKNKSEKAKKNSTKELDTLKKSAADNLAGWQRERADFENYRNRIEKRNLDLIKFANEELLLKVLPVLDNLEEALKHVPAGWEKTSWVEGIIHIKNHFKNVLVAEGLKEVAVVQGQNFDPSLCEAVEKLEEQKDEVEQDTKDEISTEKKIQIVEVSQKGYELNGKIIRPAKVKVK